MADEIRVGDRFEITVEVDRVDPARGPSTEITYFTFVPGFESYERAEFMREELLSGKRVSRPLAVGDDVLWNRNPGWRVLDIGTDRALLKDVSIGTWRHEDAPLSDLTPAPDKEA